MTGPADISGAGGGASVLSGSLADYARGVGFCELTSRLPGASSTLDLLLQRISATDVRELRRRARRAEAELYNLGITFTVYSEKDAIDRILPFDVLPRVIMRDEWQTLERGVIQRVTALNLFLKDIYGAQAILKEGVVPRDIVLGNANYREQMQDLPVRHGTYSHICGIDLIRDEHGDFRVLEDNARTPSGVSYVIENRHLMQRAFQDFMQSIGVRPVGDYGRRLLKAMVDIAPPEVMDPRVVLLSPGVFNSAYFEHVFLAREMGVPLVEGRDLTVENDQVWMRTTAGAKPVHVIYRRLDDDFLDPEVFRRDSLLGVPGLMRAWAKGTVSIANAVGTGVADDKAVYAYMPRIIRFYLGEEPVLPNVETFICREPDALKYTLDHLDELVVKPVGESGGYGMLVGPKATKAERARFRKLLRENPANYISQPMMQLSVAPTLTRSGIEPRHVDLRPFAVTGESTWVLPGGLTRVALRRGSIVVNSSQGGGSKDTWVLAS